MTDCIFCKIISGAAPSWKVYENDKVVAFLDINPISSYHTLVVPKIHCTNIFEAKESELKAVITAVKIIAEKYKNVLGINDLQILNNNGKYGQQEVFHMHFHIIPRSKGDNKNIRWNTDAILKSNFESMLQKLNQ